MMAAASAGAETLAFRVLGIDCDGCGPPIVKALKSVAGVKAAKIDLATNTATIDVPEGFDREKVRKAMSSAGFAAVFAGESAKEIEPLSPAVVAKLDIVSYTDGKRIDIPAVLAAGKITILDFYGDWCGPCHLLDARLQHLMNGGRNDLALRRVNIGKWDNAAAKQATELRVKSLPYIRVYDARGKFVTAVTGGMWDEVLEAIEKAAR